MESANFADYHLQHLCTILTDMASRIVELDGYLETEQVELDRWTYFHVSIRNLLSNTHNNIICICLTKN